jgi:putative SOS response-associated peptidase YedK
MCERYILVNTMEQIESRFELPHQNMIITPNYNICIGQFVPVITDEKPHEVQLFQFGLTPFWAKKEMLLFNARAEGDSNKEDNPGFKGSKGIILKPAFRKPIRSQRCLVLASAFIEGVKDSRLSIPYLVYLRNHKNPFAMAGIWDTWLNPQTGEKVSSFCIITTTANSLMQKIGHYRMPVILSDNEERKWINHNTDLSRITAMLNHYDSKLMNAYPIDPKIKNPMENDKQLIQPIGARLLTEDKKMAFQIPRGVGYHQARKAYQSADTSTMAERLDLAKAKEIQAKDN